MRFYRRSPGRPRRLGVLAGSFNPPTVAHAELAYAAQFHVDQVLFVVPSILPHKQYFGATLEQRLELLDRADLATGYGIATSEQGLFIDIARDCRAHFGSQTRLYFVCGRDAAERILAWDYGRAGVVEEMLREFELLVAPRGGDFQAPSEFRQRIHPLEIRPLEIREQWSDVSSTEVRERIQRGEPWEHLVPEPIVERVRAIYS